MRSLMKKACVVVMVLAVMAGTTQAIMVINPSFEDDTGTVQKTPTGWTSTGIPYVLHTPWSVYKLTSADGENCVTIKNPGTLSQDVGTVTANTEYTLIVALGQGDSTRGDAQYELEFLVEGVQVATTGIIDASSWQPGVWKDYSLIWTSGGTGDGVLSIRLTSYAGWPYFDHVRVYPTDVPSRPDPFNGEQDVERDLSLRDVVDSVSWIAPLDPNIVQIFGYDVYIDPNETKVINATAAVPGTLFSSIGQAGTSYDPPTDLDFGTPYFWRVDAIVDYDTVPGNTINDANTISGGIWNFTTETNNAIIVTDPNSQRVTAGGTVVLSISGQYVTAYQWYKDGSPLSDGGKISGATTATLTITDVQLAEEGFYYCTVDNGSAPSPDDTSESALVLTKRLVGWWKMDGDLTDSVTEVVPGAPTHDGTSTGTPTFDAGIDANSVVLNGVADNIIIIGGDPQYFNIHPSGFSISLWVKSEDQGFGGNIASKVTSDFSYGWLLRKYGEEAEFDVREDNYVFSQTGLLEANPDLANTNWHLVTATYDGELVRIYMDGNLEGEAQGSGSFSGSNDNPLVIGAQLPTGGEIMNGLIDDVKVYSYVLSPVQVASVYNDQTGASVCASLLGDPALVADINGDCNINLADFAILANTWLNCGIVPDCITPSLP